MTLLNANTKNGSTKKSGLRLVFSESCCADVRPVTTVGVCVRNCQTLVKDAIRSVLNQDFPRELLEIITIDDGSEDKTLLVILDCLSKIDMRVKVFQSNWRGLGPARNVVVDNASGDYIIWVDGDMILPKDHVQKQVEFMNRHPKVGIAKARHGLPPDDNLIASLENLAFVAVDEIYGERETSRALGTGGSIYRVEAIRQIGGFDNHLSGVGEDMDAEYRIRERGWLTYMGTSATFLERRRRTWKDLWDEGFWHGYGGYQMYSKNKSLLSLYKMVPIAGFLAGVWYSISAYRKTRRKIAFWMPAQYVFKRIAWCFGFLRGQLSRYYGT